MEVFRHGDTILPETPSDWAELLGEPLIEADVDDLMPQQLEFGFFKRQNLKVPADTEWRSWAEGQREMYGVIFGTDCSEDLEDLE